MQPKRIMFLFTAIGGAAGGYVPLLWGAGYFSFTSIICSGLGAMLGIWIAFKLTR